jgi:phage baseplate assembly protein W
MTRAISYPFRMDSTGVVYTTDINKIYLDRLLNILSTIAGQRPMRPAYGTDLKRGVYENGGDEIEGLKSAIHSAVSTWLPAITIADIYISYPDSGVSNVNVSAVFPDMTTQTVSINSTYLSQNGTTIG